MMKRQETRQGMRTSDLLRTGCVNLWRRKTRTVLTALSMTIGVMCIVVLISVGLGYGQSYQETVEAMGSLTKIDVSAAQKVDDKQKTALLNDKAVESIRKLDGVEAVTPVEQMTGYLKSGSYIGMIKLYGIDLDTAESFQITPTEGEAPTEGLRLHPELMVSDDLAGSFGDPNNNWADAVDADGNPLVDVMNSPIKLTFDYDQLNGNQKADKEGRATSSGTFYNLDIVGVCSSQNNTYSTSGFLDITRLQEWKKVQAQVAQQSSSGSNDTNSNSSNTNTTSGTNTNSSTGTGTNTNGTTNSGSTGTNTNGTTTSGSTGTNTGTQSNTGTSGTQSNTGSAGSVQGGAGSSGSSTSKDTERAAVNSSTSGSSSNSRSNGTNAATSDTYDLVWVKAEKVSDVQRISNLIKQAGFETYSLNDMLETVKKQSRQIQGVLGAIGLVSLLVAGIGVANTMMMSINERTREVGILKVLGTEFSDIAKLFLTEAFLLGLAGGVVGLILSLLMGQIIPRMFADMDIRCVFTWWLVLGSVLFAGIVALIAAWIPARKAMNISPNEAIRSE